MSRPWRQVCSRCGRAWQLGDLRWCCSCSGLLDLVGPVVDPLAGAEAAPQVGLPPGGGGFGPSGSYLRRYRAALPPGGDTVDLGSQVTPVVEVGPGVWLKADHEHPSGSFKDRGAAVMIGSAVWLGVGSVLVDSSGNAGRSVAAHARRAGIECRVYLPSGTSPAKVSAIAAEGASVVEVPGGRSAAAAAAVQAASEPGAAFYASHVYQPAFHHGVKTLAFELCEQVPDLSHGSVVVPAGNGTLVLGLWIGFGDLVNAGRLARRPALIAVQADRCAPLLGRRPAGSPGTVAGGIAIADPPRAAQIRAAAVASGGSVLAVDEADILAAQEDLNRRGFPVEPTGAVAWAAIESGRVDRRRPGSGASAPVVAVLTG